MINKYYITYKGTQEAEKLFDTDNHTLRGGLITFAASSTDAGITAEFYQKETECPDPLDNIRKLLQELRDKKLLTVWKGNVSRYLPVQLR